MLQVAKELGNGTLDVVVANAGIATHYAALDYTPEQFKEIMDGGFLSFLEVDGGWEVGSTRLT